MPEIVSLYEDNAGGLYLQYGESVYIELEHSPSSLYREDSEALLDGDTAHWTVPLIDEVPHDATLIAEYAEGKVYITTGTDGSPQYGAAGMDYLFGRADGSDRYADTGQAR